MQYEIDDLKDMPLMFDKVDLFLYSNILQRPNNHPYYEDINLNKSDLTKNTRDFIFEHERVEGEGKYMKYVYDSIENVFKSGRPRFSFKEDVWKDYFISRAYFQGYNRFVIHIIGNPTRYQREEYSRKGLLDSELDEKFKLHDNNYLYPELIKGGKSNSDLQKENLKFFPVFNKLGEFVTTDILKCGDFGSYGAYLESIGDWDNLNVMQNDPKMHEDLKSQFNGGIYRNKSCQYIEINQDLLLPEPNAQAVMRGIVEFFMSEKGRLYDSKIGVHKIRTFDNREYDGVQLMVDLYKGFGKYKIYCKTKYSIRREICLFGDDLIKIFGNKRLDNINGSKYNDFINNVVYKALKMIDLKEIICKDIIIKSRVFDTMIRHSSMSDLEKRFWTRCSNGTLLSKDDIPKNLKKLVKMSWIYDRRLKRSKRMYELKDKYRGELIEFR